MALAGHVSIVTGATRGIGKGIALQLVKAGSTVYITGRKSSPDTAAGTTLEGTVAELNAVGPGKCTGIFCDHADDKDVEAMFNQVLQENNGRLDVLVNNAYGAVALFQKKENIGKKFWEKSIEVFDGSYKVGLRSGYVASVFAARAMVPRKSGLIVNISSRGGNGYAAFQGGDIGYGVGKAALDRLSNDTAHELKKHNVAAVTLYPGITKTELIVKAKIKRALETGESVEFPGLAVVALAKNPDKAMQKTGKILLTDEMAKEFGYVDIDGTIPHSHPENFREGGMSKPPAYWSLEGGTAVAYNGPSSKM